jgi:hypothetical protein
MSFVHEQRVMKEREMANTTFRQILREEIAYNKTTAGSHDGFSKEGLAWEKGFIAGLKNAAELYRNFRKAERSAK